MSFSCRDNRSLLGTLPETDLAFRKRILEGYTNQDAMVELENELKNLPYLFDCKVRFNNTLSVAVYDNISIPPSTACIFFSGSPRNEIAEIIAGKILCPTVQTENSIEVEYYSDVFTSGKQTYYLNPFSRTSFDINIIYTINNTYINEEETQRKIRNALTLAYTPEVHTDYVKEDDVYNIIEGLDAGINILAVNLVVDGQAVDFVKVPFSSIPELGSVSFIKE